MLQRLDTPGDPGDPRMKYVPAETAAYWQIWSDTVTQGRTADQVKQHQVLFELRQQLVNAMSRAGVPIVAGTDTGTTYLFPGFSLHDELALLVQAGLSPAHALRAATYEPARFLGLEHSQGTVSKGKLADLVVLDADPLADIRNTQRIHAVLVDGRLVSSAERAQLLAGAAKAASGSAATAVARCGCHAHGH
jgi:adenine deaminase